MLLGFVATPAMAKPDRAAGFAEPADIIAAEGAFQHLRADKGAKAAIHAFAQGDAQIYASQQRVRDILNSRTEPSLPRQWQPQHVWMSCDGSYGVSYGAWQNPPATGSYNTGEYITVWHRQKSGFYKWVLNWADRKLRTALPAVDMIAASIADCPARSAHKLSVLPADHARPVARNYRAGVADDGTLTWLSGGGAGDTMTAFAVHLKQNGAWPEVLQIGPSEALR